MYIRGSLRYVHRHVKARQVETDLQKHVTVSSTSMESDVSMAEYLRTFLFPSPNIGTRARRYQGGTGRWAWGIKWRGREGKGKGGQEGEKRERERERERERKGKIYIYSAPVDWLESLGRPLCQ
ncbi:hypothetical protein ALC56_02967 [Trachymyrmex septentrionalis]|uniref:Uncharacterized protein n=1 Tax=Trachymyrmex septentrionalis TaxID=34720 RepID=A0A195FQQ6_9HYME|nr:hypothetical protein ALC56_02967 [Trachymyrmex septentrionalis]